MGHGAAHGPVRVGRTPAYERRRNGKAPLPDAHPMLRVLVVLVALLAPLVVPGVAAAPVVAQGSAPETGWARGTLVANGASGIWLTISFSAPSPEAVALMSLEYPSGSSSTMTFLWDDEELVVHSDVAGVQIRTDSSQVDDAGSATIGFECAACHTGTYAFLAMTAGGIGEWSWRVSSDSATAGPVLSGLGGTFVRDASDFEGPANVAVGAYTGVAAAVSTRVHAPGGLWARFWPETTVSASAVAPNGQTGACPCIVGKAVAPAAAGTWEFRATGATTAASAGTWLYGVAFPATA